MPRFEIEVQWHYKVFDYTTIEVEAEDLAEAQNKALHMAQMEGQTLGWMDGQVLEGEYFVNENECRLI